MRSKFATILVVDLDDQPLARTCDRLRALEGDHLIGNLVIVDAGTVSDVVTPGEAVGIRADSEDLYAILGQHHLETVRVCAINHPLSVNGRVITGRADEIHARLLELRAPGTVLKSVRVWAADSEDPGPPEHFIDPRIDANIVVIPEDRASGTQFGVPIRSVDSELFADSLAIEIATHLGLWVGMENAPVDNSTSGVIGYGRPKTYLVRSFVRIAAGPSVPIAPILIDGGRALLPAGCIETADQNRYVDELVARAAEIMKPIGQTESARPTAERIERSIGSGVGAVAGGIGDYIASLPRRIGGGATEDLTELAGQMAQEIVGQSSIIEIVWREQVEHGDDATEHDVADEIAYETQSQIDLRGGVSTDPHMWLDLNDIVSGAIDGGDIPGLELEGADGLIPVISDVGRIVPPPQRTIEETIAAVLPESGVFGDVLEDDDAEEAVNDSRDAGPTLVGQMADLVTEFREGHNQALTERIRGMAAVLRSLRNGPPVGLAVGGAIAAFFGMLLLAQVIIYLSDEAYFGVYLMSDGTRDIVWAIVSLATLVVLVLAGYVGIKPSGEWRRALVPAGTSLFVFVAILVATLLAKIPGAREALGESGKEAFGSAATFALLVGAPILALTLQYLRDKWPTAGQMARVSYGAWLVYLGLMLIGGQVRPGPTLSIARPLVVLGLTMLLFVAAIIATGYIEFRYRHRMRSAIDEVAWFEQEIIAAVRSRAMTDEVLEQFKAFGATWSYIVWNPVGQVKNDPPSTPDHSDTAVLKAGFLSFGLTERGEQELRNSTRNEISKTGWLKDQYELAVSAFQSDDTVRIGSPTVVRPDQDTRPISAVPEERRTDVSARWRFARRLLASELDTALLERFDEIEPLNIYEDVLSDRRNLLLGEEGTPSMTEFFGALHEGVGTEVSASQLTIRGRMDVPGRDRILQPTIWWPAVSLPGLEPGDDDERCALTTTRESVIVVAARSDWAGPFLPSAIAEGGDDGTRPNDDPDVPDDSAPRV